MIRSVMILGTILMFLSACSADDVRSSVGGAIEKSCRNNDRHCTVYDTSPR